jgi:hypothetical protein
MAKDGITFDEISNFATQFGEKWENYWDDAAKQFTDENLNEVFEWNE